MRKARKRVLSALLAAVLALGLMPSVAFAGEGSDPSTNALALPDPNADGIIALTEDVTMSNSFVVSSNQNVVIDLRGHTLTYSGDDEAFLDVQSGSLTIRDSDAEGTGKVVVDETYYQTSSGKYNPQISCVKVSAGATFTLESGTLTNTNTAFEATEVITNYGTTNIRGGVVEGVTGIFIFNPVRGSDSWTDNSAICNVSGGNIVGVAPTTYRGSDEYGGKNVEDLNWSYGIAIYGPGFDTEGKVDNTKSVLNISGGTITAGQAIGTNASSGRYAGYTINMTNGTVNGGSGTGMYLPAIGETNISGGTVTAAQAIRICAGELNVTGGDIICNAVSDGEDLIAGGSGGTLGAIVVGKASNGYVGDIVVNVSDSAVVENTASSTGDAILPTIVVSDKNMAQTSEQTITNPDGSASSQKFTYSETSTSVTVNATIKGDVVKISNLTQSSTTQDGGNTSLDITGGTVTGDVINQTSEGDLNITGAEVIGDVKNNSDGAVVIEGATVTGAVSSDKNGNVAILNSTVTSTAPENATIVNSTVSNQYHEGDSVALVNGKGYKTLELAVIELSSSPGTITLVKSYTLRGYSLTELTEDAFTIPVTATLAINDNVTLTVPESKTLNLQNPAFLDSKGSIKVQAGGTLKIPNASGTPEAFVGADNNARINLSSGDLTFDIGDSLLTLGKNAVAEVPEDKEAWLLKSTGGTTKTPLDAVIEADATLTVNGTLNAISGSDQSGSILTVKGELDASSGTLSVAKHANVRVEDGGKVALKPANLIGSVLGKATVLAGGTVEVGDKVWIGEGGNVVLSAGSMALDFTNIQSGKIAARLADNAKASVPSGMEWTLKVGESTPSANVDLTVAEGSTLDVAGNFKVANNSTLTLNGALSVSGTGCLTISSEGAVNGSGSIANSGVLVLNKGANEAGKLNVNVALKSGGKAYSQENISGRLSSYREMSNKTYGGTAYAHAWEYYVAPTPAPTPTPTPEEFDVAVADVQNGAVELSAKTAKEGQKVTVTVTPDLGWELAQLTVADEDGDALELTENADGTYSFTMPAGDVTVHASFADAWENPFTDLSEDHWGYGAVRTANLLGLMKGIGGTTLFAPDDGLLREQAATVMWNLMGAGDVSRPEAPQADVDQSQWYAPYVNWAVDSKVMDGYSEDDFGVGDSLTREQFAAVVAKAVGADVDSADQAALGAFPDADGVSGWARATMAWAVEAGVLNGVGTEDGSRELQATRELTRAEMATMMVNAIEVGVLDFGA